MLLTSFQASECGFIMAAKTAARVWIAIKVPHTIRTRSIVFFFVSASTYQCNLSHNYGVSTYRAPILKLSEEFDLGDATPILTVQPRSRSLPLPVISIEANAFEQDEYLLASLVK